MKCHSCNLDWTQPPDNCPRCGKAGCDTNIASNASQPQLKVIAIKPMKCTLCDTAWTSPPETCPRCFPTIQSGSQIPSVEGKELSNSSVNKIASAELYPNYSIFFVISILFPIIGIIMGLILIGKEEKTSAHLAGQHFIKVGVISVAIASVIGIIISALWHFLWVKVQFTEKEQECNSISCIIMVWRIGAYPQEMSLSQLWDIICKHLCVCYASFINNIVRVSSSATILVPYWYPLGRERSA